MTYKRFVKARKTKIPAARSQANLEQILRRYGASGFGVSTDYESGVVRVFFRVPDLPGAAAAVPVRLEVDVNRVLAAMYGELTGAQHWTENARAQGERVAWRQLVDWVDAALSAASAGLQPVSEAFLAHTLVKDEAGVVRRLVDQMDATARDRGETGWRALFAPPTVQQ